ILDGRRIELPNNSMFVCFAPKENPKIAIAVTVENAGFGATWAGPIARMLMEKYLNDTLQAKSKEDFERISKADLIPKYYARVQYKEDSIRAYDWFKKTKDSSYIKKYVFENYLLRFPAKDKGDHKESNNNKDVAISKDERTSRQKQLA